MLAATPVAPIRAVDKRKALRAFKQRGYVVSVGALEHLLGAYALSPHDTLAPFLAVVFELLSRPDGAADGVLTAEVAEAVASRLVLDAARRSGVAKASVEVIDVFGVPRWGAGKRVVAPHPVVCGVPEDKGQMFRSRYELVLGKTLRNKRFTPPASGMLSISSKKSPYLRLTGIESLAGTIDEKLVLGMLTQLEEGSWFLEDLNGSVKVDLSQAHATAGFHSECSFVIAQGTLVETERGESIFQVTAMGTPPLEKREMSLVALGKDANLFGGQFELGDASSLLELERSAADAMFLLVSDVALDNPRVMAGLRHIFEGYLEDEVVPTVVALMGNFLSHPFGQRSDDVVTLAGKFAELGEMISSDFAPLAESTTFIIVPGPSDPGPGNVLPRPAMPAIITDGFVRAIGADSVHLGTNPCRVRYMTQELVLLREDLMHKMIRHCCIKPDLSESGLMSEHLVKSVVDQAHMCPLPNSARPTLWGHDHAMWLFPTPHAIVLADRVDGYICKYGGALGLNPGSFAADFSFSVYLPAEKRAQQCSLDSESVPDPEASNSPAEDVGHGMSGSDVDGESDPMTPIETPLPAQSLHGYNAGQSDAGSDVGAPDDQREVEMAHEEGAGIVPVENSDAEESDDDSFLIPAPAHVVRRQIRIQDDEENEARAAELERGEEESTPMDVIR